jgi:hypothetical protein
MPAMNTSWEIRWRSAAVLSIAMALAIGCGEDDKAPGSPATGGSGGTIGTGGSTGGNGTGGTGGTSPAADAGGSADAAGASDTAGPALGAERFVGEWDYMSGGLQLSCPGSQPVTQPYLPTNYITFTAGAGASPLILALTGCNLRFDIQGQTALVQPGQTCAFPVGTRPTTRQPDTYTFAIEGDLLRESSRWTVTFTDRADPPCTLTSEGLLTRHR